MLLGALRTALAVLARRPLSVRCILLSAPALQEVARRLSSGVRRNDVIARYGGEEFTVLLPGVDDETIRTVAERLRAEVADQPILLEDGSSLRITVSIGIASVSEGNASVGQLKLSADQRLYEAKATGRNRVVTAS